MQMRRSEATTEFPRRLQLETADVGLTRTSPFTGKQTRADRDKHTNKYDLQFVVKRIGEQLCSVRLLLDHTDTVVRKCLSN